MKQAESIQSLIVLLLESQQTVSSLYFYDLFAELLCRRSIMIMIMMIIMIILIMIMMVSDGTFRHEVREHTASDVWIQPKYQSTNENIMRSCR